MLFSSFLLGKDIPMSVFKLLTALFIPVFSWFFLKMK
jgi:hypothetical protein